MPGNDGLYVKWLRVIQEIINEINAVEGTIKLFINTL